MSDTLQLLGKLAGADAGRDAVHVAVAPVTAAHILAPGEHVGFVDDDRVQVGRVSAAIGIVDPYLREPVMPGQRFYLFLYPQTITSLRHVWQHPAFPDEGTAAPTTVATTPQAESEAWLREFAEEMGVSYGTLLNQAVTYLDELERGERWPNLHVIYGSDTPDRAYIDAPEMWRHLSIVTGRTVPQAHADRSLFTCSC